MLYYIYESKKSMAKVNFRRVNVGIYEMFSLMAKNAGIIDHERLAEHELSVILCALKASLVLPRERMDNSDGAC